MATNNNNKPPKVAFTFDPNFVRPGEIGSATFNELYRHIFLLGGQNYKNVFVKKLINCGIENDVCQYLQTNNELSDAKLIIHSIDLFKFQCEDFLLGYEPLQSVDRREEEAFKIERFTNSNLTKYFARENRCEGLTPSSWLEYVKRKDMLSVICQKIGVPTPKAVRASTLIKDGPFFDDIVKILKKWKHGFYLKKVDESCGNDNDYFAYKSIDDLLGKIQSGDDEFRNMRIVQERIETPHPDYSSHYRIFSFQYGGKTNILSAVLYYNTGDKYTVHGLIDEIDRIPLSGPLQKA